MPLEPRQIQLLRALTAKEKLLREQGRPPDFIFLQMPGPAFGLKPDVDGEEEIRPMEADFQDLEAEGHVRLSPGDSPSVLLRLTLTAQGRAAGALVTTQLSPPPLGSVPPTADAVLAWLRELSTSTAGASAMANGGALLNEAIKAFGSEHVESVALSLIDLGASGLLLFEDPAAAIEVTDADRIGMATRFRLPAGTANRTEPPAQRITQIINAATAQVAAGDIHNYGSFEELLDLLAEDLDHLTDIDEEARDEARGILDKLRSASSKVTVGAAASGGGALIAALLKQKLGLP
jgi:urease beta subunit